MYVCARFLMVAAVAGLSLIVFAAGPKASAAADALTTVSHVAAPEASTSASRAAALEALAGPAGEYHAQALYSAIIAKHGERLPYANIVQAEVRHADMLKAHLEKLGASIPSNAYMGKLAAPETLEEAAKLGIASEKENIEMYDRLKERVPGDSELIELFDRLQAMSRDHHLQAFERAASRGGEIGPPAGSGPGPRRARGAGRGWRGGRQGVPADAVSTSSATSKR